MKRHSVFVWVLAIASAIGVDAAVTKFNSELMDRDLRITEGILKDLLGAEESDPVIPGGSGTPRVQGTYHDGYGVLFNVEGSRARPHVRVRVSRHGKEGKKASESIAVTVEEGVVSLKDGKPVRVVVKHGTDKRSPNLQKERIVEFMNAYAGAIRQLKPGDRITVRLNAGGKGGAHEWARAYFRGGHGVHEMEGLHELADLKELSELSELSELQELGELMHTELKDASIEIEAAARELATAVGDLSQTVLADYGAEGSGGSSLVATILKKDLDAHQGSDELAKKITFEEAGETAAAMGRDIHVFKGILQSFLGKEQSTFGRGTRPTGFYQKGIGAVFFLEHQLGSGFTWAGGDFEWMSHQSHAGGDKKTESAESSATALAGQISNALADYGATLKSVASDEQIIVNVRLRGRKGPDVPSRLVVKVSKDAVSRYSQGKLSLEKFMKEIKRL
jgi:hypothetical protein